MDRERLVKDRFLDALRRAEEAEARCLIGPPQECSPKIIEAHWLQEAKLRQIASKDGKVLIMTPDSKKRVRASGAMASTWKQQFEVRSIANRLMKGRMACRHHDIQTFSKIENRRVDPTNPEHCLLLAYRAALFQLHEKRVVARTFGIMAQADPSFTPWYRHLQQGADIVERVKVQLDNQVIQGTASVATSQMDHRQIPIESEPKIAATAFMLRDGPTLTFTPRELAEVRRLRVPRSAYEVPIILTVYPEPTKQVAIVSFPKGRESLARIIVPAIGEADAKKAAALLSKTLLEESENIMVSLLVWNSFRRTKQTRIFEQFMGASSQPVFFSADQERAISEDSLTEMTHDHVPAFIDDCDPEELNLFS